MGVAVTTICYQMMRKRGVVELLVTSDGGEGLRDAATYLPPEGTHMCVLFKLQ